VGEGELREPDPPPDPDPEPDPEPDEPDELEELDEPEELEEPEPLEDPVAGCPACAVGWTPAATPRALL
jgi:hypothetical protein